MNYSFSFLDLFPYLLLVIICFYIGFHKFKNVDSGKLICIVVIVFSAIRVGIGYDYYGYMNLILKNAPDYSIEKVEFFAKLLMEFSYWTHYQLFFVITSFLTLYPLYLVSKKYSENVNLSLIIYLLFPIFFLESLSIIRNAVAYTFIFWAFYYFLQHKYLLYTIISVIAIGFHISACIGLLLPLVYLFQCQKKWNILFYIFSLFSSSILMALLSNISSTFPFLESVEYYVNNGYIGSGNTMKIVINMIAIFNLFFWRELESRSEKSKLWLNITNFGAIIWNLFSFEGTLCLRLSSFFLLFLILLLPSYLYIFKRKYRQVISFLFCTFFILLFSSSFYINIFAHMKTGCKMSALPYQTIFYSVEYPLYVNE